MKRFVITFLVFALLTGCSYKNDPLDKALKFRQMLLAAKGVRFDAEITVDYFEELTFFTLACETDDLGNLSFSVIAPETIEGITGSVFGDEINLQFDDTVLAFKPINDGQVSPVIVPWIFVKALRSGYIRACASTEEGFSASIQDSYDENAILLEILFDESDVPYFVEVYCNDRKIISIKFKSFQFL